MLSLARLLISHGDGDDAILEVAHEALFGSWAPLRQAIEASADQLRGRTDLERWARDWETSGCQDAYLLRDERLKAAQRWAASDGEVIDGLALVAEFLAYSNQADRAAMERLSEQQRAHCAPRTQRRRAGGGMVTRRTRAGHCVERPHHPDLGHTQ